MQASVMIMANSRRRTLRLKRMRWRREYRIREKPDTMSIQPTFINVRKAILVLPSTLVNIGTSKPAVIKTTPEQDAKSDLRSRIRLDRESFNLLGSLPEIQGFAAFESDEYGDYQAQSHPNGNGMNRSEDAVYGDIQCQAPVASRVTAKTDFPVV